MKILGAEKTQTRNGLSDWRTQCFVRIEDYDGVEHKIDISSSQFEELALINDTKEHGITIKRVPGSGWMATHHKFSGHGLGDTPDEALEALQKLRGFE